MPSAAEPPAAVAAPPPAAPPAVPGAPPPLAAVGLVGKAGGHSVCTGTLIAPTLVLTAAHCVGGWWAAKDAANLVFRPSNARGTVGAEHPARRIVVREGYGPGKDEPVGGPQMVRDMALIVLERPVDAAVAVPLPVTLAPPPAETLFLVSFRGGKPPLRSRSCPVLDAPPSVLILSCDVQGGESGSPVLIRGADGPIVVGVISRRAQFERTRIAIGAWTGLQYLALLTQPRDQVAKPPEAGSKKPPEAGPKKAPKTPAKTPAKTPPGKPADKKPGN